MGRKYGLIVCLLLVILALASWAQVVAAASSPGLSAEDTKNIMPVSQLKRGMRGYGLTVFQGTKIEKFDFEVLGVLKQMNTGRDLILIRAGGGPITSRNAGIIAGMSGSPCYINGKIIGAVSMASSFSKEPIGMVTPIADMLEAWDENLPKNASGYSSQQSLSTSVTVGGRKINKISIDQSIDPNLKPEEGTLYMQPISTPLMVSGMSSRGLGKLAEILRPFNISPLAGPGAPTDAKISASLNPGAAVGMSLARGDIDITAIGTLTYRRGNKVVAFGHPMLSIGAIDAPMTTAYVTDVISSYMISTKLGSPLATVGRFFQDRPWSIAGAIGNMAQTIPATIQIDDQSTQRKRTFRVNVINHPLLASMLLTSVVDEAIFDMHPTPGDATAELSYDIVADQVGKISRSNVFFDPTGISGAAITDIGTLLMTLSNNRFYPLDIKSVNVRVNITGKRDTANIDRIFVKKSEYEPGETVEVGVVLRPYKKDRITKTFSVKIPATVPEGKITLQVRGGASPGFSAGGPDDESSADSGAPILSSGSALANADNVKQLVSKYLERERNNEVVVRLLMRSTTLNVGGDKLTGLPNAIADVMKSSKNSSLKLERDEVKQTFEAGTIVYGSSQLIINVKRKDLKESKSLPKPSIGGTEEDAPPETDTSSYYSPEETIEATATGEIHKMQAASPNAPEDIPSEQDKNSEPIVASDEPVSTTTNEEPSQPGKDEKPQPGSTSSAANTDIKTVVRQVKTWTQRTQTDFEKGTLSGVSASSDNMLELVPTMRKLVETPEQFVWCVVPTKDGVYAGTGDSGKIYHITDAGEMKVYYETGELEVHSLAVDPSGNVYAGTSPHGKIFKITPDGKGKLLFKTDEHYVVALTLDKDGNLYAGVGDAGKIYQITPDGAANVFAQINEQQILSLHWDNQGWLLAGTGINGVVYRVDKLGKSEPIFDAPEDSITSITSDGKGNVYAGTSPKGFVYKISSDGRAKNVLSKASRVLSMVCDSAGNVYAVSDGTLVKILPDDTVVKLDSSKDKVQYLALTFNESTKTLYAGTGNVGSVYASKCSDFSGTYESPVHDAGMISKWCRIKWNVDATEGNTAELRTRIGNVATPDSTWTDWSAPYTQSAGAPIVAENARYIQCQVTLRAAEQTVSPKVTGVTLTYLTPNQAPDVKLSSPLGGEVWAGNKTIRWVGSDPDKDKLSYDIYYSGDKGKDWIALVGGDDTASTTNTKIPTESEIREKLKTELEKSPDVPEDVKRRVLAAQPGPPGQLVARPVPGTGEPSTKSSHELNTTKLPDGAYIIKVIASDKTSNGTGALTDEIVSEPFVVCNKPPAVSIRRKSFELKDVGPAIIDGTASSTMADIVGVQYRLDGEEWLSAIAADDVFDSPHEDFKVTTASLATGMHKVEVQAIDTAGNATSKTIEVKIAASK